MRETLYALNISDDEIDSILKRYSNLGKLNDDDVKELIQILEDVSCDEEQIRNIIIANPLYLYKYPEDIRTLIEVLEKYGCEYIFLMLEKNPYILNINDFQLEQYIEEELAEGRMIEEIMMQLESNPTLYKNI